ncbi:hypothetical protein [Nocardioides solisilvae]|uniref:hypothetical protein n=1 Tax=Nocardioides solisilvae TaxID=1542435 RepID=UPI000D742703|nr:hypothetical protein [Nocardioides solisilvae]
MTSTTTGAGRTLTITRDRHRRLRRDAVLQVLAGQPGRRRLLLVGLAAGLVGIVLEGWLLAAVLLVAALLAQVLWWRHVMTVSLRRGLDVGQSVEVAPGPDGGVLLTDEVDEPLLLGPGSAQVARFRSLLTVFVAHGATFMLPVELLTADEIAALEGRHLRPGHGGGGAEGPRLARESVVTPEVQQGLVAATTHAIVASADFLVTWLLAPFPVLLAVWFATPGTAVVVGLALTALLLGPSLLAVRRSRAAVRAAYPVGAVVEAAVTGDALLVGMPLGTLTLPWRGYARARVRGQAVVLTLRGRTMRPDHLDVLPLVLLGDEAVVALARVGGR